MIIVDSLLFLLPFIAILGFTCGLISAYAVARRMSFVGDIMSHATFPGIAAFFLIYPCQSSLFLLTGAALSAAASILIAFIIGTYVYTPRDTLLSIVLCAFFSIGTILLSLIQKKGLRGQAIINNFLFGNIFSIFRSHALFASLLCLAVVVFFMLTIRRQKSICFDISHYHVLFGKPFYWEMLFYIAIIVVVTTGIQTIGLLLIGSLIIAPGAFSKLHAKSYEQLLFYSVFLSTAASVIGFLVTLYNGHLPTGPVIIIFATLPSLCTAFYRFFKKVLKGFL